MPRVVPHLEGVADAQQSSTPARRAPSLGASAANPFDTVEEHSPEAAVAHDTQPEQRADDQAAPLAGKDKVGARCPPSRRGRSLPTRPKPAEVDDDLEEGLEKPVAQLCAKLERITPAKAAARTGEERAAADAAWGGQCRR